MQKGHKAAILDVYPQATESKWTDRRTEELPWVVPTHAVRLGAAIEQAKNQGVDFIVIDTPPHSSTDAAEAARRADVVVSPVEPHLFGLETVSKLADLLRVAGDPPSFFAATRHPPKAPRALKARDILRPMSRSPQPSPLDPEILPQAFAAIRASAVGSDASHPVVLLDVREPWEFQSASLPESLLMPMGEVTSRAYNELDPDAHIVVICHHGARSLSVAMWLRGQGYERAQSLAGGIDAWSRMIDPAVPRY